MIDPFDRLTKADGVERVVLRDRFDVERDAPQLAGALASEFPSLLAVLASLRRSLPLAPHARVGEVEGFIRIPNHYRSVTCLVPSDVNGEAKGAIVFKGTEPLLKDFPEYFDWMLRTPFRGSRLPLGLHFPLELKLPPAAMWIQECVLEGIVTSEIQTAYLAQHGRLARLPVPLFAFQFTSEQVDCYRQVVKSRLSSSAFRWIEAKIADGLGVEVYYYPGPPVRAVDLLVPQVKQAFKAVLNVEDLEATFSDWIRLMADLLALGYMPYAPWNRAMGGCVDPGNACIDGGFNDLLTIVRFDSIPGEQLFWRSLGTSILMLTDSVVTMCTAFSGTGPALPTESAAAVAYVTEGLREHIRLLDSGPAVIDPRLGRFFRRPSVEDLLQHLRETHREKEPRQFTLEHPSWMRRSC